MNGDGKPDLCVAVPYANSRHGAINAYSSAGALLWSLAGTPTLEIGVYQYHYTIGKIGDLDGDGCDDIVVTGIDRIAGTWVAPIVSGKTGTLLRIVRPNPLIQSAGDLACDGCGDIDGDGFPDFVFATGNAFEVFSGKTGLSIRFGTVPPMIITSVRSRGIDFDNDGVPDFVISGPDHPVYVISGRDGSWIANVPDGQATQQYGQGFFLAVMPRQPGSPFGQYVTTDRWWYLQGGSNAGRIRVVRVAPTAVEAYGSSCQGSLSRAPGIGLQDRGNGLVRVHLRDAAAGGTALLMIGRSRTSAGGIALPFALDPYGFTGCSLFTSSDLIAMIPVGSTGFDAGYVGVDLPVRLDSTSLNAIHVQWLALGTGMEWPGAVTAALALRYR